MLWSNYEIVLQAQFLILGIILYTFFILIFVFMNVKTLTLLSTIASWLWWNSPSWDVTEHLAFSSLIVLSFFLTFCTSWIFFGSFLFEDRALHTLSWVCLPLFCGLCLLDPSLGSFLFEDRALQTFFGLLPHHEDSACLKALELISIGLYSLL